MIEKSNTSEVPQKENQEEILKNIIERISKHFNSEQGANIGQIYFNDTCR